mgnify:CR=1 FL=1
MIGARAHLAIVLLAATPGPWAPGAASAQTQAPEVRFARQFSMGYLQFNVMEKHRLVEKHASAAGLPATKVSWATFNSPAAMNDALLSGSGASLATRRHHRPGIARGPAR